MNAGVCSQIFLKKHQSKPYNANSWSIVGVPILTFAERPNEFMTNAKLPKSTKEDLVLMDTNLFPYPYLVDWKKFKEWTINKLMAVQVPPEYIGRHGVCGLSWPPLEYYDANHLHLINLAWFKHRVENLEEYLLAEEGEMEDVDSDEDEKAEYHDGAVRGFAAVGGGNVFAEALAEIRQRKAEESGNESADDSADDNEVLEEAGNSEEGNDPLVDLAKVAAIQPAATGTAAVFEDTAAVEGALAETDVVESALADPGQLVTPGATIVGNKTEDGACRRRRPPMSAASRGEVRGCAQGRRGRGRCGGHGKARQ